MKYKTTQLPLLFIIILVAFNFSCTKDKHAIVGSWRVDKIEQKIEDGEWENLLTNCSVGSIEEYEANGKWTYYPAPGAPCGTGPSPEYGTYKLTASGTKLVFIYDDSVGEYIRTIESITETTMIRSHTPKTVTSMQFRYTFTKL